jgi:DNA replication protein DnaC
MSRAYRSVGRILENLLSRAPNTLPQEEPSCQLCHDRGWIVEADGGAGKSRPCKCHTDRPIEILLRYSGVGDDLLHAEMSNLKGPLATLDLSSFPVPDSCLTLLGPVGTGKSHLAVALLRRWLLSGRSGRFVEVRQLLADCRVCMQSNGSADELVAALSRRDLLVLDEAYADRRTDFADDLLSGLIRRRLRDRRPTIITTNLTEDELERIEPRVASRATGAGAIAISTKGQPDRRRAAPAAGGSK